MTDDILIIPDVHGRTFWRSAIQSGPYAKIIFLGDYVDPYDREGITFAQALDVFNEIIALKKAQPEQITLLLGNHDLHYYSELFYEYGGGSRYNWMYAHQLEQIFNANRDLFVLSYETTLDGRRHLFTHAGVTAPWYTSHEALIGSFDAAHLNHLLESDNGIIALGDVGYYRGGFSPSGSMVWADIHEMQIDQYMPEVYQIFGHTQQIDGPHITADMACLDCRQAFVLDPKGMLHTI
jgi:hypothetical protein